MLRYYLSDFEKILKEGIDYEIPQETIEMINSLVPILLYPTDLAISSAMSFIETISFL